MDVVRLLRTQLCLSDPGILIQKLHRIIENRTTEQQECLVARVAQLRPLCET